MRSRLLAGALIAVAVVAVLALWQRHSLWRAAYPHLPPRIQAVPYRLRAVVDVSDATPIPLPTVDAANRAARPVPTTIVGTTVPATAPTTAPTTVPTKAPTTAPEPAAPNSAQSEPMDLPPEVMLRGLRHEYQTWNNCGPATISMVLSYFGASEGQAQAARHLKPDPDDKNVSPEELARYAREQGLDAVVRVNGTADTLRALLALGVPVVVETWFVPEPGDEMGHYRVLVGYSDAEGHFLADDSYNGPGVSLDYDQFDQLWRVFNRTYAVAYPPELSGSVAAAIGHHLDDTTMHAGAVERAQAELSGGDGSSDAFGWFNLGSGLLALGDTAGAASAYDQARAVGLPWRMLWYQSGPFDAYAAEGRWEDVVALADANLRNAPNLEESHYWLGHARLARGDHAGALEAWRRALELNPLYGPADEALQEHG